jgi:prepilin-type N-terminal cleavage/methylation domain-containing protein
MNKLLSKKEGFTLIELMIVVAIIGSRLSSTT